MWNFGSITSGGEYNHSNVKPAPVATSAGPHMDRPLAEHIALLEQRLQMLNQKLMESTRTLAQRNRIEGDIRMAEMALAFYRKAFELERRVS